MLRNILFRLFYLQITEKSVPLHCVFHSIRFKVNKGWSKALLLFLCPYVSLTFRKQLFYPSIVITPTAELLSSGTFNV